MERGLRLWGSVFVDYAFPTRAAKASKPFMISGLQFRASRSGSRSSGWSDSGQTVDEVFAVRITVATYLSAGILLVMERPVTRTLIRNSPRNAISPYNEAVGDHVLDPNAEPLPEAGVQV